MVSKKRIEKEGRNMKAQLSAFILMGLVIMTIFFFLYYVRQQIRVQKAEEEIDIAADILQKTPVLNYYVTVCLQDSVEEALILAGKQGGNIYIEQGGLTDRNSVPIFRYNNDNITYGMTSIDSIVPNAERLADDPTYPLPPEYPCIKSEPPISYVCPYDYLFYTTSITPEAAANIPSQELSIVKFFPFSLKHLPLLCIPNGPNDVAMGVYPFPCPSGSYGINSIQEQIKAYAEKRLWNCTNFSSIKQMINFNITANMPQIMPIMGENDIVVKATYPINITVGKYGAVRLFDFEVKIPVRLKRIYSLAQFIVDNDRSYIDFNMTPNFEVVYNEFWDPYIRIRRFCPKCSLEGNEKDTTSLLQINDSGSNIRGNDYFFVFAVENRIPALDWIHKTAAEETEFDYIVQEGDEIVIEPKGYDPDDEDVYYTYDGWKQTYDEVFDPGCCNEINPNSLTICKDEPWKCVTKSGDAVYQMCANGWGMCMDNCLQNDKYVWDNSLLYTTPNPNNPSDIYRRSNYITKTTDPGKIAANPDLADANPVHYPCVKDDQNKWTGAAYSRDLGPHNITIKVCDINGKCDWQIVRIMVTDIPQPVIELANDYGTQDASLEDPFTLDASKSNIFSVVDTYVWGVTGPEGTGFQYAVPYSETQNGRLKIPHPFPEDANFIETIKGAGNFFSKEGMHTLSLTIGSQTAAKEIDVKQCIPYQSPDKPYPYNTGDPFMADHACCEPGGIYSTTLKICYNTGEYGSINDFDGDKYKYGGMPHVVFWHLDESDGGMTQEKPSLAGKYGNDIFYRKFERYCSGDRGNICSGTGQEDMMVSKPCNDIEYAWQDERCQGPSPGTFATAAEASCIDYAPLQTFEFANGIGGSANGLCSDTPKCTDGIDYTATGHFLCNAAVCDNGHCTKPYTDPAYGYKCMCNAANGCGASSQCTIYSYDDLKVGGICLPSRTGFCDSVCNYYEPDNSQTACQGCYHRWNIGGGTEINADTTKCCGDEASEHYLIALDGTDACCDNRETPQAGGNLLPGNECVINGECKDRVPTADICNGIDDDCSPMTADGAGETPPLNSNQQGICASSRKKCSGAGGWQDYYLSIIGYQAAETDCDDNKDNDCDGKKDCLDPDCSSNAACQT